MQLTSLLRSAGKMALFSVLSLLLFQMAQAQSETVLYNFCSVGGANLCYDGEYPLGPLAADGSGNFYTTSTYGGANCATGACFGTVFGLSPEPAGGCGSGTNPGNGWCEFVLYNFCSLSGCADGSQPEGSVSYLNAHFRTPGNFYGTTTYGGSHDSGIVFEISAKPVQSGCPTGSNPSGGWCETVLYNFCSYTQGDTCLDGNNPVGNLVEDPAGNLYGTVRNGVFQLSPNQQGGWDSELIYADNFVQGGLAIDGADNLYGIDADSIAGVGHVFKISLSQANYPQVNIHTFKLSTNGLPNGSLTLDSAGNVYGTTFSGGTKKLGTVWKLIPVTSGKKAGTYQQKVLHVFSAEKTGEIPEGGVLLDASGNIYSTTTYGGGLECQGGCGTVFELVASGDTYKYKLLWSFNGTDGAAPYSSPVLNSAGVLYGVTSFGGANNLGTMYEVTP